MKKLITIAFAIVLIAQAEGQGTFFQMHEPNIYRKYAIGGIVVGMLLIPFYDANWHKPISNEKGLLLSSGFDAKMAFTEGFDGRAKISLDFGKLETGFIYEYFPAVRYQGFGIGVDYTIINRKLSLLTGIETTRILNYNTDRHFSVQSVGINLEVRYILNKRVSISYLGNFKTRPELSEIKPDVLYSGYLHINYLLMYIR